MQAQFGSQLSNNSQGHIGVYISPVHSGTSGGLFQISPSTLLGLKTKKLTNREISDVAKCISTSDLAIRGGYATTRATNIPMISYFFRHEQVLRLRDNMQNIRSMWLDDSVRISYFLICLLFFHLFAFSIVFMLVCAKYTHIFRLWMHTFQSYEYERLQNVTVGNITTDRNTYAPAHLCHTS